MDSASSAKNTRLYLIDGSGYIFRAYHALPPLTRSSDGAPVGAVAGFCNMLWKFLQEMKGAEAPTHLAVIFDKSEVTFRNELYSEYKAHRPPAPEDLAPQFPMIRDAVRAFGVACVEMGGFEADDLIATYARQAAATGATVRVVSSDKDLMQLIVENSIELYDPMKNRKLGVEAVMEKFGVGPDKVIDVQALIGDSVDNVPGAPGIGPKTAAELMAQFGSLDEILARAGEIKQNKRRETLINFADQIRLSRTLVTLRDDVAVEEKWPDFAVREPDKATLLQFLDAMEFRTLARRVREEAAKEGATIAPPAPLPMEAPPGAVAAPVEEAPIKRDVYECVRDMEALTRWLGRARDVGVIGIDAEADAIDPQRADLVGVSICVGANEACYVPLTHARADARGGDLFAAEEPEAERPADTGAQIPLKDAIAALKATLEDPSILKVGYNVKFALNVFAKLGVDVGPVDDVLLMSYAIGGGQGGHEREDLAERLLGHTPMARADVIGKGKARTTFAAADVGQAVCYAAEDAEIALRLWKRLRPQLAADRLINVYETLERPLPAVLAPMERAGIKIDPDMLSRLSGDFAQRMLQYEQEAYGLAGREFNMGSPKQLGEILFDELKLSGGSKTKTGAWSTDATILEELADQHDLPRKLLDWRQLAKLRSTYTEALREAVNPETKRVHTTYVLASTTTGRLSSNDPNLQNIPIRTEEGRRIREAFIAEKGNVLVSADYSQIELRLLAHVANIPQLKQAFADGVDIHARTASEMFGVPVEGMPKEIRSNAKAINFGIIYGISAFGLARNLGIEREEAAAYIKRYFERFPGIRDYMEETKTFARANGYVKTLFGRRIWVPGIKSKNPSERAFAERQSINAPLQGAAADIIRRAMARLPAAMNEKHLAARMLLQVHDELVFEAPQAEAEKLCALARDVMEAAPSPAVHLSVPLTVEAKAGATWGAAH